MEEINIIKMFFTGLFWFCTMTIIVNITILSLMLKLYTEIFKQKKMEERRSHEP